MLKGKSLLEYTNLFSPNDYENIYVYMYIYIYIKINVENLKNQLSIKPFYCLH